MSAEMSYLTVLLIIFGGLILAILAAWWYQRRSTHFKNEVKQANFEKDKHDIEHKVNETDILTLADERNKRRGTRT